MSLRMQLSVLQAFQCHVGLHPGMSAEEIRSDALGRCREGRAVRGNLWVRNDGVAGPLWPVSPGEAMRAASNPPFYFARFPFPSLKRRSAVYFCPSNPTFPSSRIGGRGYVFQSLFSGQCPRKIEIACTQGQIHVARPSYGVCQPEHLSVGFQLEAPANRASAVVRFSVSRFPSADNRKMMGELG